MKGSAATTPARRSAAASRTLAAATRVAERLLVRTDAELQHVDRPTERKVCDRVVARLLDTIGALAVERARIDDPEGALAVIDGGRRTLEEARWGLGWVRRRRAVAPSVHNALAVGASVVERRLEEARREIARIPGRW